MAPSVSALKREKLYRECGKNVKLFCRQFVKIRVPKKGIVDFDLYEAQERTLDHWESHDQTIALKARQIGFSTLVCAYVLWWALFKPYSEIILISRRESDAKDLVKKIKLAYKMLPEWVRERAPKPTDDAAERITFDNGSLIESQPSAADPARGKSVDLIVVDEFGQLPNADEAWASIEPTADIGGKIILLGTAKGAGSMFHDFYVSAKTGASDLKAIFHSWRAVPSRDDAWYEAKKRSLRNREWILHQEYPSNDVECWLMSGGMVFDYEDLQSLPIFDPMRGYVAPKGAVPGGVLTRTFEFVRDDGGPLSVWRLPMPGESYVIGADVAEGLEHGDFSSAHVINVSTGEVVAHWHGHVGPDLFGTHVLWALGWLYNCALVGVEVNNHGLTTCLALQKAGYPKLYYRHTYDERTRKRGRKIGWRTQANTKPMMVDELAAALRPNDDGERELRLFCAETKAELETFVRDEKGRMGGSPFDDRTVSLAIANQMLKHASTPAYTQKVNDAWTADWWIRQIEGEPEHATVGRRNRSAHRVAARRARTRRSRRR